jgi:hypothetical protein
MEQNGSPVSTVADSIIHENNENERPLNDHHSSSESSTPTKASSPEENNVIENRERPTTMLTPDPKRSKMMTKEIPPVVAYPTAIQLPSRKRIAGLFKASLEDTSNDETSNSTSIEEDNPDYNDQQYLKAAGILSLEQVLLPALGIEEEKALKQVQAKIQRDAPEYRFVMENCRRFVRKSIINAVMAVQESRTDRVQQQRERRQQQALDNQRAREARKEARRQERLRQIEEEQRQREITKAEAKRRLTRQHPKNQELWKEVVYLTSSIAQLEREQRMWMQVEQDLVHLEKGNKISTETEESHQIDDKPHILEVSKHDLHIQTEQKVRDIMLASSRIQKGLGMVLKLLKESEEVRKELYEKYRKDHVFHGYQSIDDPKSMIRFLSQSQDDDIF